MDSVFSGEIHPTHQRLLNAAPLTDRLYRINYVIIHVGGSVV